VATGRYSASQHNRAGEALTLIIYASIHHPGYDLDYTSRANVGNESGPELRG